MTKHFLALLTFFICFLTVKAQQKAIFTNTHSGKTVIVKQDDMLKLVYKGYLGQVQEIYGRVDNISDSLIRFTNNWTVRTSDILGFRRFSKYRDIIQGATDVVILVGVVIVLPIIVYGAPNLSAIERLGITFGIGAAATAITSEIFSTKIKNFMKAGWEVRVE